MDGLSLTIGGSLGAAIVGALVKIYTASRQKATIEPSPLPVQKIQGCVSVAECNRRMREIDDRLTKLEARTAVGIDNILRKLDALDEKSEERAVSVNRRLDPIVEKVAELGGSVDMIKSKMFKR